MKAWEKVYFEEGEYPSSPMLNFAQNSLPLEWVIDSIDTALKAVDSSLELVGGALGTAHPSNSQASRNTQDPGFIQHLEVSCIAPDHYNNKAYEHVRDIPAEVLRQLQEAGVNIEFLSRGELHEATLGFEADGKVIDDHEGGSLQDKLRLTQNETISRENQAFSRHSKRTNIKASPREELSTEPVIPQPIYNGSFVFKLLEERLRQEQERQLGLPPPPS